MKTETIFLFPTRLVTVRYDDCATLNREIETFLSSRPEFAAGDFDMHPDAFNLLDWASECDAIARLGDDFIAAVREWLRQEYLSDDFDIDCTMFSNIARKGDFTIAHNHSTDLAAVYYVRVPQHGRPVVEVPTAAGSYEYFEDGDGALVLHDPRFNANLMGMPNIDYARVFPVPGLMVVFPGYLWHSVTPVTSDATRLSIAANFRLVPRKPSRARRYAG